MDKLGASGGIDLDRSMVMEFVVAVMGGHASWRVRIEIGSLSDASSLYR